MRRRKSKKSGSKIIAGLVILGLLAAAGYIYTAPEFERVSPTVEGAENIFWNKADPLKIHLRDNRALKHFELILNDGQNRSEERYKRTDTAGQVSKEQYTEPKSKTSSAESYSE